MDAAEFVSKWRKASNLGERSAAQQHYLDLCELFGVPKPAAADPEGAWHTFEKGVRKLGGGRGFADVWMKDRFAWEYKKKHKDLDAAFNQLLQYVGDLDNPPLLVACDLHTIVIRRHFTGYPAAPIEIPLEKFDQPRSLDVLRKLFHEPGALRPEKTTSEITDEAVRDFAVVAPDVRARCKDATEAAHFLDRLVFCMFAEDVGLLPNHVFSRIVEKPHRDPRAITRDIGQLFEAMAAGGSFWGEEVPHFNGTLFDDRPVVELRGAEFEVIKQAAGRDWGQMDVSIFGTLFERVMDESQRKQLGAHYTGFDDIRSLVEPVVMVPLRREWNAARDLAESLLAGPGAADPHPGPLPGGEGVFLPPLPLGEGRGEGLLPFGSVPPSALAAAQAAVDGFLKRLRGVRVLDPACGSGNFLYVTLKLLKDLEKEVQVFCRTHGLATSPLAVGPHQLFGIEINEYAYDLAQMTVWIGWIQWHRDNGFPVEDRPILRALDTIRRMDAILDTSDPDHPREPAWPAADFIVGNPPFLGDKRMRKQLGDDYVNKLRDLYSDRIPGQSDLCCYWFEKARAQIEKGKCSRAGLLATQGIRGGANRVVLNRIKESGDIFFGISDRNWVIDGANVHVSLVGFDDGTETVITLDGKLVDSIHSQLSSVVNISESGKLAENENLGFIGVAQKAPFDLPERAALTMLRDANPSGNANSDVLRVMYNAQDVTQKPRGVWNVDFGLDMKIEEAALYEMPFELVKANVLPLRIEHREKRQERYWWLFARPCPDLRRAISGLSRYFVTPRVSKHRIFKWLDPAILCDSALVVFARTDDYFFGVLHSRFHEVWARAQGTQVRERESGFRYTPTTCFETFPMPEPTAAQAEAIGAAAKRLDELRNGWLNPPEWTRTEVLEFPGSASGPWARYVHEPDARGIGTVCYPRVVPRDDDAALKLSKRTLTALYNARPTWLDQAHRALDAAVAAAYGWPSDLADDAVLSRLLALNLARAGRPSPKAGPAAD